jgi:hypothetical protein
MQNGTIETCNAMFYDDGGPNGNYHDRKDYTMTFLPNTPGGMLEAIFEEFALETNYDFLYIYDGSSTNAPQIGEYTGLDSPDVVTATNSEGALTFRFSSDYGVNETGWKAIVHCVGVYDPLEIEVFAEPQTIIEGESTQLSMYATGGTGSYTYRWEPADMVVDPDAQITSTIPLTSNQLYTATITDAEGNTISATIEVTVVPEDVAENQLDKVQVYPNPSKGCFTIEVAEPIRFELYNSMGQLIIAGQKDMGPIQIQTQQGKGIYFLHIIGESGSKIEKIIIE